MMNRVFVVGRITRDPELRNSANGHPYVYFSVAVNRLPLPSGERIADFINCVAWNRQAENLARFIRKGGLIGIEGKLQTRSGQNQDGTNRTVMEVVCDSITFLESKNTNDQSAGYDDYHENRQYNNSYNSYSAPNNQNFGGGSYNSYGNSSYNSYSQQRPNQAPKYEEPSNPFADEAKGQLDITDDDLPF